MIPEYPGIRSSKRIAQFKTDFFVTLGQTINSMRAQGRDVIRLDMGSPDFPPPDFLVKALIETTAKADQHGYTPNGGTVQFKQAAASYYFQRFGVQLDPQTQILGLLGSKTGLFSLAQVILNPGDISLIPSPGYPTYTNATLFSDAQPYYLPLLAKNDFLPDLDNIPNSVLEKAKILWLNYPNNPTGARAPIEFLEKAIAFAKQNHCIIAYDNPYSEVYFGELRPQSILQLPEAMDCCVELNSLSKSYNIAGWRLGIAAGNPELIKLIKVHSSLTNSSHFAGIWEAGRVALTADQSWLQERNQEYAKRRDIVVDQLRVLNFEVESPKATIYVWAKLPTSEKRLSTQFCQELLQEQEISITPGSYYGDSGEGFIRVSLTINQQKLSEGMQRVASFMNHPGN